MFRELSAWHLGLILLAFIILFGYKKLPDATRSLGRSMRIFKSEVKGLHDDDPKPVQATPRNEVPAPPSAQATPTTQATSTTQPNQAAGEAVDAARTDARVEPDRS